MRPNSVLKNPWTLDALPRVKADSLLPQQHQTRRKFAVGCDFYVQRFVKYPDLAMFHSLAELLFAALLEGDPDVRGFVPQPFSLHVGGKRYTPDFFVQRGATQEVVELKAKVSLPEPMEMALSAFFDLHGMRFFVERNERVMQREQEARNWLDIVRRLAANRLLDTSATQMSLWQRFQAEKQMCFSDVVDVSEREASLLAEIALLTLLHKGRVRTELSKTPLLPDQVFELCT
jgi:hypothetical protein